MMSSFYQIFGPAVELCGISLPLDQIFYFSVRLFSRFYHTFYLEQRVGLGSSHFLNFSFVESTFYTLAVHVYESVHHRFGRKSLVDEEQLSEPPRNLLKW